MEKFWYKKAEFSDVPVLIEASMKELLEDFHWDIDMQKKFKENYEEAIPRLMKEETLIFYLLYQESTFVGMARMYVWKEDIAKGEATLSGIYILPEFRENDILQHLFDMLVKEARKRNCTVIKTVVSRNREQLHKLGFQDLYDYDDEGAYGLSSEMELPLV